MSKKKSRVVFHKVHLRNFGATSAVVITDPNNTKRKEDFIKAWSSFDGFDYVFSDSIFPKDFDIEELLKDGTLKGEWHDYEHFGLTENMIGIALAHKKAWEFAWENVEGRRVLFLEDDARPSRELCELIFNGEYKKFIDDSEKYHSDIMWVGRTTHQIQGERYTDSLQKPNPFDGIGAHAYILDRSVLWKIRDDYKIDMPVDLYLDTLGPKMRGVFPYVYSPYFSLISQQSHMLDIQGTTWDSGFSQDDDTHPDFIYSTTSQVNRHFTKLLPQPWSHTSRFMYKYCEKKMREYKKWGVNWKWVKLKGSGLI